MKWKLAVASLVATFALCTQTQGFDLLDRMLGGSGCGCASSCCETQSTCCDTGPSCGCDIGPSCGCDMGSACGCDPCGSKPLIEINLPKIRPLFKFNTCNSGCGSSCGSSCGCDLTPSCGCDITPSCGCDPCGACDPCNSCSKPKLRLGLLDRIFKKKGCGCGSSCEASCGVDACGCSSGCGGCASMGTYSAPAQQAAPVPEADSASLPPTPIVDPSAFIAPRGIYNASNR